MDKRSPGSKLSGIASVVIISAFFLPWVRACNHDLTGYDVATNSTGQVETAWIYWLVVLAPVFCLVLYFVSKDMDASSRIKAASARLVAGVVGFVPLLNIWYNVQQRGGALKVLYGGWMTVLGYLGIGLSFFLDIVATTPQGKPQNRKMVSPPRSRPPVKRS